MNSIPGNPDNKYWEKISPFLIRCSPFDHESICNCQ